MVAACRATVAALLVGATACGGGPEPAPGATQPILVRLIVPRGEVEVAPREYLWEPVPGATSYSVKIADADAIWPLFVRRIEATALVLDAEQAKAIVTGRIHVWEVEALDAQGALIGSGATRFRVRPEAIPGGEG